MLYKFRFKNHSCFYHWQEIDLIDIKTIDINVNAVKKGVILGGLSSGKSSIVELLNTTINYMKHFLTYNSKNSSFFNSISDKYNPFLFTKSRVIEDSEFDKNEWDNENNDEQIHDDDKINETFDHRNNLLNAYKKNSYELYLDEQFEPTSVELYLCDSSFLYKYELVFNANYPIFEGLSYKLNDEEHETSEWVELYSKKNIEYNIINGEEKCIFETSFNEIELELTSKPSTKHLNEKNSMINFLKSISKSIIIKSFSQIINRFSFISGATYKNSFKSFQLDKDYLINNKEYFIGIFQELQLNIVDYTIAHDNSNKNNFSLMIGKVDEDNNKIYINSKFESTNVIKLFQVIYHGLKAMDNKEILVIDNLDKNISINQIGYLFNLIQKTKNLANKEEQFIFTLNNNYVDDVLGISNANNEITTSFLTSKISRVY